MNDLRGQVLLVTGGAGFIGSNFVIGALAAGAARVYVLDALTYAGHLENLAEVQADPRYTFVHGNIADRACVQALLDAHRFDSLYNFAAESHVDRSIAAPAAFIDTNLVGTFHLLEAVRAHQERVGRGPRFVHVSTDEVYGSIAAPGRATEDSPIRPRSPYAAAKAGAEALVLAWTVTYGLAAVVTRGSNTYGRRQYPEKLIPLFIRNGLRGLPMPLYGDGDHVRDWLHVEDHCAGIARVGAAGEVGQVYNLGTGAERTNREVAAAIAARLDVVAPLGHPHDALTTFVADRSGHDRRYAMNTARARGLGWEPLRGFAEGLADTIAWYQRAGG